MLMEKEAVAVTRQRIMIIKQSPGRYNTRNLLEKRACEITRHRARRARYKGVN